MVGLVASRDGGEGRASPGFCAIVAVQSQSAPGRRPQKGAEAAAETQDRREDLRRPADPSGRAATALWPIRQRYLVSGWAGGGQIPMRTCRTFSSPDSAGLAPNVLINQGTITQDIAADRTRSPEARSGSRDLRGIRASPRFGIGGSRRKPESLWSWGSRNANAQAGRCGDFSGAGREHLCCGPGQIARALTWPRPS